MIRLVLVDMDHALGTRDGRPLDRQTIAQLHQVLHAGIRLAPMSARGRADALALLGGDESCLQNAVLRNGAELVADGMVLPTRATTRVDGARELMRRLDVGRDEVLVLGGATADAELLSAVPASVATTDASKAAWGAAKSHLKGLHEGGVAQLCQDVADAAEWGEEPAFLRAAEAADSGVRAEFGATPQQAAGKGHAGLFMFLGIVVVVAGFVLYLSNTFPSIAGMMVLTVGLLVGVALFYMGLTQRRDARKARKAARRGE